MDERITKLAHQIDSIRVKFTTIKPKRERTFEYAIVHLFANLLVRMDEIYYLLCKRYPHGAIALSRSLMETIVIMDFLAKHKDDTALLDKFYDSADIFRIQMKIASIELYPQEFLNKDIDYSQLLNDDLKELDVYKNKYKTIIGNKKRFPDYWWTGFDNFSDLANASNFKINTLYKLSCKYLHINPFGLFYPLNRNLDTISVSKTDSGLEQPLGFSAMCLIEACDFAEMAFPQLDFYDNQMALGEIIGVPFHE